MDFATFLENPELELAVIATPSLDHARNAEPALATGKTVRLEKPGDVTAADYEILQRPGQRLQLSGAPVRKAWSYRRRAGGRSHH